MSTYHKIHTMFKRNMDGDKKIIFDDWAEPEVEYLKNNQWQFTEKVDGTNIRVYWDGKDVVFGGRTNNAQIPNGVVNRLNELFYSTPAKKCLREFFPEGNVVFYGEGYGGNINSGGNYKPEQDFIMFDIRINNTWLERENVIDIGKQLGVECVPVIGQGTLYDAIELVKNNLQSKWGDFEAEGIVARPTIELTTRRGGRIIAKIKAKDFNA